MTSAIIIPSVSAGTDRGNKQGDVMSIKRIEPMEYNDMFDIIRQIQATLAIENMTLTEHGLEELQLLVKGSITREEYQKGLKERYQNNALY